MTLLAEDLLLLLLDDEKGTVPAGTQLTPALGGAVLAELSIAGAVEVEENQGLWRRTLIRADGHASVSDPVLAEALGLLAEKQRDAQRLVNRVGRHLDGRLYERLSERGILRRERGRILGIFPRTTWPSTDSSHEDAVRSRLYAALVDGEDPDPRSATLIALLRVLKRLDKAVPEEALSETAMSKKERDRRAKEIAEGEWASAAVKKAIDTAGAVLAAVAAGGAASSGGS